MVLLLVVSAKARGLMLQVQVRVLETMLVVLVPALVALVLVPLARVQALVLQVLTGGDSGNLRGLTKPMRTCGMSTTRRWLRWNSRGPGAWLGCCESRDLRGVRWPLVLRAADGSKPSPGR